MLASLALLMASAAAASATPPADESRPAYRPMSSARATATATIRVISGVRFGSDHLDADSRGSRRSAQLTDAAGQLRDAELLEFQ